MPYYNQSDLSVFCVLTSQPPNSPPRSKLFLSQICQSCKGPISISQKRNTKSICCCYYVFCIFAEIPKVFVAVTRYLVFLLKSFLLRKSFLGQICLFPESGSVLPAEPILKLRVSQAAFKDPWHFYLFTITLFVLFSSFFL